MNFINILKEMVLISDICQIRPDLTEREAQDILECLYNDHELCRELFLEILEPIIDNIIFMKKGCLHDLAQRFWVQDSNFDYSLSRLKEGASVNYYQNSVYIVRKGKDGSKNVEFFHEGNWKEGKEDDFELECSLMVKDDESKES